MNSDKADFEKRINEMTEALAKTKIRNLWISIDSADGAVHESMRGLPGCIKGIEKALPIFHQYGIYPSVNLGINRNIMGLSNSQGDNKEFNADKFYNTYRQGFEKFYSYVIDLGFTMVNACYPMSVESDAEELSAVYGATSIDDIVKFSQEERVLLFKALFDTIPKFRSKIRIFSPRTSLHTLIKQYMGDTSYGSPCRGGIDFFFVDAKTANTYPCGYKGKSLGKFWDLDLNRIDKKSFCKQCDWECFRDPSELLGNLVDLSGKPIYTLKRLLKDREYRKLLIDDFKYYKACDFFDGRRAPNYDKLAFWTCK